MAMGSLLAVDERLFEETRLIVTFGPEPDEEDAVPPGEYAFMEHYCDDLECPCRRVMLVVTECERGPLATISLSLDPGDVMAEPFLDPMHPQAPYAEGFLEMTENLLLTDREYVARLERHHKQFRKWLSERPRANVRLSPEQLREKKARRRQQRRRLEHRKKSPARR